MNCSEQVPEAYSHTPELMTQAAALTDAAYNAAEHWYSVAETIRSQAAAHSLPPEGPLVRELGLAASYTLKFQRGIPPTCDLSPKQPVAPTWPAAIADVSSDVVSLWAGVAEQANHPHAKGHFYDLLFVRRAGNVGQAAREAIDNYGTWASQEAKLTLDSADALVRAWQLARQTKDDPRESRVRGFMLSHTVSSMTQIPLVGPGAVFRLLEALSVGPRSGSKQAATSVIDALSADIDAALQQALTKYPDSYLVTSVASMIRHRASTPEAVDAINRREVRRI